jgi:hypothetical protein
MDWRLTVGHPEELHDSINATFAGMAHFAGTGPKGARCRECTFWADDTRRLNKLCRKHKALTGRRGPLVPGAAAACKYFQPQTVETDVKISEAYPSRFYKYAELGGKPVTKVISHAEEHEVGQARELRPVLYFEGEKKGMVLNRRNASYLAGRYGDDSKGWAGKPIELYPTVVEFGNKPVETIRLRLPAKEVGDAR